MGEWSRRPLLAGVLGGGAWLAIALATCNPSFATEKVNPRPNFWGVWMGLNGAPGVDPRYRAVPYTPTPEFTPWGAAESKRMASPLTPGRCDIWNPVMFMEASALFPIQILDGRLLKTSVSWPPSIPCARSRRIPCACPQQPLVAHTKVIRGQPLVQASVLGLG